ncbi:MAG: right-handed parallel beta-helix repeat-containing protein [bacterium]
MYKIMTALFLIGIFPLYLPCSRAETIEFVIEKSPYLIYSDLIIKEGETLTIEPGVIVELANDTGIIVKGSIDISGYPNGGEVIFKAQGPYQNFHKGYWKGVIIKSKKDNILTYSVIQHAKIGIKIEEGGYIKINNNMITQNKVGIRAEKISDSSIHRNSFYDNFVDIEFINSSGEISNNFFQNSPVNINLKNSYPKIKDNYFKQIHKHVIESYNKKNLQLGENWWGFTEILKIKTLILEKGKGKINFEPFLEKPLDLTKVGVDLKE